MLSLKEFQTAELSKSSQKLVNGGGKETGPSTRGGKSYECDWETDSCEMRCYNSDGSIDIYYCA